MRQFPAALSWLSQAGSWAISLLEQDRRPQPFACRYALRPRRAGVSALQPYDLIKTGTVVNHTVHKPCSLSDFRSKYPSLRIALELSHNITAGLSHGMLTLQTIRELIAFPHRPS